MLWPYLVFVKVLVEQNACRNDPSIIPIMSQIEGLKDFHYWGGSQYYIQQADDNSRVNGHDLNGEPRKNPTNTLEEEHKAHSLLVQYLCRPHFARQLIKLRDSVKCQTVHYILPPLPCPAPVLSTIVKYVNFDKWQCKQWVLDFEDDQGS